MESDDFERGDAVIRDRLLELARENGVRVDGVVCRESRLGGAKAYVYELRGTSLWVSLRARDVQHAAERESMTHFIEPRLASIFPATWWGQSVVLLKHRGTSSGAARSAGGVPGSVAIERAGGGSGRPVGLGSSGSYSACRWLELDPAALRWP